MDTGKFLTFRGQKETIPFYEPKIASRTSASKQNRVRSEFGDQSIGESANRRLNFCLGFVQLF